MTVYTLRKTQSIELDRLIEKNVPVIIIKNFLQQKICKKIIDYCINVSKNNPHRKISKEGDFYSVDVYPQNVITQRLFRKYMLGNNFLNKFKMINQVIDFQYKKILKPKKKIRPEIQVVHYPRGGGYFDEHKHERYPSNYGIIITLSKKGRDFDQGVTSIKYNNKYINLEKNNITCGDLILFRFDLPHKITPVDPDRYLSFDEKGRWTLILNIAPKHLSLSSY
jgi:hypothetical protein